MPYERQQVIYKTCQNYCYEPPRVREKIEWLCSRVAEDDANKRHALFRVVTSEVPIWRIANEHYIAKTVLYELRKRFYELW